MTSTISCAASAAGPYLASPSLGSWRWARRLLPESIFLLVLFVISFGRLLLLSFGMPTLALCASATEPSERAEARREFGMRPGFKRLPAAFQLDPLSALNRIGTSRNIRLGNSKEWNPVLMSNFMPANLEARKLCELVNVSSVSTALG